MTKFWSPLYHSVAMAIGNGLLERDWGDSHSHLTGPSPEFIA